MTELIGHPVAELFPLLDKASDRYRKLVTSIERNGLWHPIVLDDVGRILDGRNRARACADANVEPSFVKFSELSLGLNEDGDPVAPEEFAFDQNFARRDLTDDQRVTIYARYGEYLDAASPGAPKGNLNASKTMGTNSSPLISKASKPPSKKKRAALADKAGVSEHKAQQALNVARKAPDLAEQVTSGKLKLRDAAKLLDQSGNSGKPLVQQPIGKSHLDVICQQVIAKISKLSPKLTDIERPLFRQRITHYLEDFK